MLGPYIAAKLNLTKRRFNMDCLFCKIISGEIQSKKLYEDAKVLAFEDLNPIAPVHILIIPKKHISSADELNDQNSEIVGYIFQIASKLAKSLNLNGFRLINNCGADGGQSVQHLHFHLLGGKKLNWDKL